jgi:hypothetical protein
MTCQIIAEKAPRTNQKYVSETVHFFISLGLPIITD